MELRRVRMTDALAAPLLVELAVEYEQRYGAIDVMADATPEQFDLPDGTFLLLLDGERPVAGGGIRRVDAVTCELKRMWTSSAHRRRGHARTVVQALEEAARGLGYMAVRLETGPAQPEASALYTAMGYRRIPVYGAYPPALAFERRLAPDGSDHLH